MGIYRIGGVYEHYGILQWKEQSHPLSNVSKNKRPEKIPVTTSLRGSIPIESLMKIYSPVETVKRARSQIGKKEYSVLGNNCEHFAVWCKTGVHKRYQIDDILAEVTPIHKEMTFTKK